MDLKGQLFTRVRPKGTKFQETLKSIHGAPFDAASFASHHPWLPRFLKYHTFGASLEFY